MSYKPSCDIDFCSGPAWSLAAMLLVVLVLGLHATFC
jgi:hypothetical protein